MCQPLRMLSSKRNPRAPGKGRISERDWDQESAAGVASEWRSKGCAGRDARNLARRGEGTSGQGRELGTGRPRGRARAGAVSWGERGEEQLAMRAWC